MALRAMLSESALQLLVAWEIAIESATDLEVCEALTAFHQAATDYTTATPRGEWSRADAALQVELPPFLELALRELVEVLGRRWSPAVHAHRIRSITRVLRLPG